MGEYPVTTPITAVVGPIKTCLRSEEEVMRGGWQEPDYYHRPRAVTGWCWVTFRFGEGKRPRVTSKAFKARRQFWDDEPSAEQVETARRECVAEIRSVAAMHGLTLGDDHPIEHGEDR